MLRWIALSLMLLGVAVAARANDAAPGQPQPAQPPQESQQPLTPYQTALTKYKNGNYVDAKTAIDEADKEKPNDPPTVILKARILIELRDYAGAKTALESLNKVAGLTPEEDKARTLAFGDLNLHKGDYDAATKFYESLLDREPGNPDTILKVVYSRAAAGDLVEASKYASQLKPMDPDRPNYYFAKAAITQATTGGDQQTGEDISTARTIYGITMTDRYLKTYLQVFANKRSPTDAMTPLPKTAPSTNAAPTGAK